MELPEKIPMRVEVYGDGAKGLAFQIFRNDEYGVQMEARREKHGARWIETLTSDFLPNRTFSKLGELREALKGVEPKPFVPEVVSVEPKLSGTARCYLCRGEATHRVYAKVGWRDADIALLPACGADLEATKADPLGAREARRKWVREHPPRL